MKKKSGKRFLSWLLAAVMIIALMPANAFAEPPTESSGNTEPAVTAYCPSSEGGTDVSVEGYDSSPAAETKNTPTEEPAKDTPAEEPAKDTPAEEPVKDTPAEEPVKESPVADKTTEDTPAQEGAVENSTDEKIIEDSTNEASAADLAGLTAMFGAPELLELYTSWYYPVYVYGCFKHNGKNLDKNAALYINDNETAIKWNGDASKGEYYITFGKLTDATGSNPLYYTRYNSGEVPKGEIPTNDIETRITNGEVDLASKDTEGSAQKNGLATTGADVNKYVKGNWSGLKPRKGAEGFPETGTKWSWHIDGTIDVYRVTYTRGNLPENEEFTPPKESTYFLDDYTVRGQKPTSRNYRFTGWEYKGETYNQGDKVPASKKDITLVAQWAPKEKVYTVNYNWGSNAPEGVTLPTDNTPYNSEIEAKNAMDTTYVNGYEHKTTDGTYTFSGWTENKGTTDYSGDKIVTPITFTGTWTFTPKPVTTYKVVYEWGSEHPSDVTLPTDSTSYDSESEAKGAMDTKYTNSSTSNAQKDGKEGLWKFSGWTPSEPVASTTEENTEVITFTGTWTFAEKVVNVTYDWGNDVPSDVVSRKPADKTYNSVDAAKADMDKTFTSTSTSNAQKDGKEGLWTFSGWTPSEPVASTTEENTEVITFTGTWTFAEKVVNVTYDWGNDVPSDVVSRKPADKTYNSVDAAKADMDKTFTSTSTSNAKKGDKEGLWTFSGWTPSEPVESNEGNTVSIKFTGTWTFAEKVVNVTYNWGTPAPSDKTCPTDGTYNTEEAARNNMDTSFTNASISNAPNGSIAGSWTFSGWTETKTTSDDGNTVLIALTGTWNFTPSETKTITGVLNGLVQKEFKSQYGYSTEGTFTAIAKVMPVHPEINSYAAEVDESSDNNTNTPGTDNAKTFTGTVNLKTGETRAFNFSAGKGVADVLDPDTYYEVRVSEVEGNLSKVTYDTTKYILTFTTDRNAVVDYIGIAKQDNGEAFPELAPIEDDKPITFQNIYTYKRSHSSGDSGNGGGKKEEKPTVEIKDDDALGLNNTDHFAYIVGYGNGEVRPQNSITRAEVAAIFFRLLEDDVRDANYTRQNKFTDVSNDAWYCSAVSTLSAMGIISGYPDATFRPNASITRAEFAAIATRFDVNGDKTPASFNDIAGHWAKDEIAVAANNGWVNGYEDGSFRPQNKITRAETMSLVNRVLNRKPETAEDLLENMTKWTDNADTNAWYYLAVQEATNSHYYEYKENSQYEKWTELRETRDWSELDK